MAAKLDCHPSLQNVDIKKQTKTYPYQAEKDGKEDKAMKEAKGHNQ